MSTDAHARLVQALAAVALLDNTDARARMVRDEVVLRRLALGDQLDAVRASGAALRLRWLDRLFDTGRALDHQIGKLAEVVADRRFDLLERYLPPDQRRDADQIDEAFALADLLDAAEAGLWLLRSTLGHRRIALHHAQCAAGPRSPHWLGALERRAERLTGSSWDLVENLAQGRYRLIVGDAR